MLGNASGPANAASRCRRSLLLTRQGVEMGWRRAFLLLASTFASSILCSSSRAQDRPPMQEMIRARILHTDAMVSGTT